MFKRNKKEKSPKEQKETRAQKKNRDVTELLDLQRAYIKGIDVKFAAAESITDAAEKILTLQALVKYIGDAASDSRRRQMKIIDRRVTRNFAKTAPAGLVATTAAIGVPLGFLFPPLLPVAMFGVFGLLAPAFFERRIEESKTKQLLEKNPDIKDFAGLMTALGDRAGEVLHETVQNCNLEELPLSPRFKEALASNAPLRERFAEAAAVTARQTLEEKAEAEQDVVAEPVKTPREPRSPVRLKVTR